jgi:uncharacterized protein YbgA (DUF1722 family)
MIGFIGTPLQSLLISSNYNSLTPSYNKARHRNVWGKNPITKNLMETLEYIIEHPNDWLQESTTVPQEI